MLPADYIPPRGGGTQASDLHWIMWGLMGIPDSEIDTGVRRIFCGERSCAAGIEEGTAANGTIEGGEVFEAAVKLLEKEEEEFAESGGKSRRKFTELVSTRTTFRVPWILSDFNPKTTADDETLLSIAKAIDERKARVAEAGFEPGTLGYNRYLAGELTKWMLSPEGLYARTEGKVETEYPILSFLALPKGKRLGDCTELSRLGYAVFRLAGLKTSFVDVQRDAVDARVTAHMALGLWLDPERPDHMTTVDLYYDGGFSEEGHDMQSEMPAVTSLAIYLNNRALDLVKSEPVKENRDDKVNSLFLQAFDYDPYYGLLHYNYAIFLKNMVGDAAKSGDSAARALELRPFESDILSLIKMLERLRKKDEMGGFKPPLK